MLWSLTIELKYDWRNLNRSGKKASFLESKNYISSTSSGGLFLWKRTTKQGNILLIPYQHWLEHRRFRWGNWIRIDFSFFDVAKQLAERSELWRGSPRSAQSNLQWERSFFLNLCQMNRLLLQLQLSENVRGKAQHTREKGCQSYA